MLPVKKSAASAASRLGFQAAIKSAASAASLRAGRASGPLDHVLGRDIRRFSEDDFRKDQKRPSGNSLFHDPDSFALALGSEIDVYRHGLDRAFFEKNAMLTVLSSLSSTPFHCALQQALSLLSLCRSLQFVSTVACHLLSVLVSTFLQPRTHSWQRQAPERQGSRLNVAVLAEWPVISWGGAVSAQLGRSAEQVTQGCVRPFPDSRQVIS